VVVIVAVVSVIGFLLLPPFDVNRRQRANEATAAARLRLLTSIEKEYAKEHTREGYVCELVKLRARAQLRRDYDPDFFSTGNGAGYTFVISGCETASDTAVRQYRIIAIPMEPGKSGRRFFCTDETGVLRYTLDESSESCLASRNVID
jgi:hypothetical protein